MMLALVGVALAIINLLVYSATVRMFSTIALIVILVIQEFRSNRE